MSEAREVTCTLCGIVLPVPVVSLMGVPGGVTLDDTFVNEHVEMHTSCSCEWTGDTGHMVLGDLSPTCAHHGLTDRAYSATSDSNILSDLLTNEEDSD